MNHEEIERSIFQSKERKGEIALRVENLLDIYLLRKNYRQQSVGKIRFKISKKIVRKNCEPACRPL